MSVNQVIIVLPACYKNTEPELVIDKFQLYGYAQIIRVDSSGQLCNLRAWG